MSIASVTPKIPQGVELVALRRQGTNLLPRSELVFAERAVRGAAGHPAPSAKREGLSPGRDAIADRQHLDYMMVYVSKPSMVGMRLADVPHPPGSSIEIIQIRRGDADILPRADLM